MWLACAQGDYAHARMASDEALRVVRSAGDPWMVGWVLTVLGYAACLDGDTATARQAFLESEKLWRQVGELGTMTWSLEGLGQVALLDREYTEARERFSHALVLRQELGDRPGIANCLDGIGGLLAAHAKRDEAIRIAGAAEALRNTLQLPLEPMRRDLRERWLGPLRGSVDEQSISAAWAGGQYMDVDEAVAFALAVAEQLLSPSERLGGLTRREQDVATLVAGGLTNRQIGERLVIAERTTASHIEHILTKLGFTSRTQIGIWAVQHGLTAPVPPVGLTAGPT
jgi:DNA-binding CsgD family transcriptional regulator